LSRIIPVARTDSTSGETPIFERIAVVGFGLIGGSIALAARERWPSALVIAVDRKAVVETAMRMHAAEVGGDDLVMAAEADLVVLAAPVRQNIAILRELADHVRGRAVVTDVGSTKQATMDAAAQLPERLVFVGGHPLAGAAAGGVEAARPDLFRGRPWILTRSSSAEAADLSRLEAFITGLGGLPRRMDAAAHDRLVAYLSHLPQLTVSALMHVVGERTGGEGLALAGRGLRDTTRLASSPPGTWRDVAATNVDAVSAAIDDLTGALQRLKEDLKSGDELQKVFESAARWKQTLEKPEPPEGGPS
jgi:prephenate dehydrogenase